MLVGLNGARLSIRVPTIVPEAVMQAIIDGEVLFARLGLSFQLRCIPCMRMGEPSEAYCQGGSNDDGTVFTIECGCRARSATGHFVAPSDPGMPSDREPLPDGSKRTEWIPNATMREIDAFERALKTLELQYLIRCLRCQMAGRPDGVWGVTATTDSTTVMECTCTVRKSMADLRVTH